MDRPFRTTIAVIVLAVATVATPIIPVHAGKDKHREARALLQQGEILPLDRILRIVQERVPGDIIEVELDLSSKHGWEYEVKVLATNGRVLEVDINARTGEIRKIEDD